MTAGRDRPVVAIQGLGYVGAAMAVAVAAARDAGGEPSFDVVGLELPTPTGTARAEALAAGSFPFATSDGELVAAARAAREVGNLSATTDVGVLSQAAVTVVDIPLDLARESTPGESAHAFHWAPFRSAIRTLGERMSPGSLVLIETTVPPGTCERIVAPELASSLASRGLPPDALLLAHSYERVMPGDGWLESIVRYWRVYAGATLAAADACERFLERVVDVDRFPLTRLSSTLASETAKLLENTYRAVNIALVEEWGRFAEAAGFDLFEVIAAIRRRPSHSNLRQPGFGVGGYCLTKDPLFAAQGARELWGLEIEFPFATTAIAVNQAMPGVTLRSLERLLGGLAGRRVLLLGVSYRPGVGDTRESPAAGFVLAAEAAGAEVALHDPMVGHWPELDRDVPGVLPSLEGFDAVVFAVGHAEYRELDFGVWLGEARPLVFDASGVLTPTQRAALDSAACPHVAIGRGMPGQLAR